MANLTVNNFVAKIKEMSATARENLTAAQLVKIILQIPADVVFDKDAQVQALENKLTALAASLDLTQKQSLANSTKIAIHETKISNLTTLSTKIEQDLEMQKEANNFEEIENELELIKSQINDIEQYLRINNLEVVGVPLPDEEQNEDEEKVLIKTLNQLRGLEKQITSDDIDTSHPIPSRRSDNKRVVVVRFISRKSKFDILAAKKMEQNHDLKFRQSDIYINEHLSPVNRGLFAKASEKKKELRYRFCWTKNGVPHLRKDVHSDIIPIKSTKDLENLH